MADSITSHNLNQYVCQAGYKVDMSAAGDFSEKIVVPHDSRLVCTVYGSTGLAGAGVAAIVMYVNGSIDARHFMTPTPTLAAHITETQFASPGIEFAKGSTIHFAHDGNETNAINGYLNVLLERT